MNTISALYKLPWIMSSSEENVYPSEKILLLLLYYFQIQLKLCIGATGASYKCYFDLYIIYFHISMSVFPQESPVFGSEILWQCRCCIKKWGSGICHFRFLSLMSLNLSTFSLCYFCYVYICMFKKILP